MDHRSLAAAAARHHGVLLPTLLDGAGVSAKQRQRCVRTGLWRRLPNGVLVVAGVPVTFEMRATAAQAGLPGSTLSHPTAGLVHGFDLEDSAIHLTVEPGSTSRARGAVVHRMPLDSADVTRRRGFRVTSVERTLVDLGALVSGPVLRTLIETELLRRSTTFTRVEATHLRLAGKGRRGAAAVRRVLADVDGMPPTESALEAAFVRLLQQGRVPVPDTQVTFDWSLGERGRVDCCYPAAGIIVELDGRRFHERSAAFERDRRRDQLAATLGYRTLRFTHRQVTDEPRHVAHVVRSVLGSASLSR